MIEKAAMGLTALALVLVLAAGFTKNEILVALFLAVYLAGMICWGVVWLQNRRRAGNRTKWEPSEKQLSDIERMTGRSAADDEDEKDALVSLRHEWGGRAEHGDETLVVKEADGEYRLVLVSREWNDAGPSRPPRITRRNVVSLRKADAAHKTLSGFLFSARVLNGLPAWAEEALKAEKDFECLFAFARVREEPGRVYWANHGDPMEQMLVWFEKKAGVWNVCARVTWDDVRMNEEKPLPEATDRNIAKLLMLDPVIYLRQPDIENWYTRDRSGEILLHERTEPVGREGARVIQMKLDPRNGALYRSEIINSPTSRMDGQPERAAAFMELAAENPKYQGMNMKNWRTYLPDRKKELHEALIEARDTFSEEEMKQFNERFYQYTQDVGRGGTEPAIAAANRRMVLVDGRPVPEEMMRRMRELEAGKAVKAKPAPGPDAPAEKEQKKEAPSDKKQAAAFRSPAASVELYRHKRKSFYDEESGIWLQDGKVMTECNTTYGSDHSVFDLPPHMSMLGCTRGEILSWLKEQRCVVSFGPGDCEDETVVIPRPRLVMAESLPMKQLGREQRCLMEHFYYGSTCRCRVSLRRKEQTDWLVVSACWNDDVYVETAVRDDGGHLSQWQDESLLKYADRMSTAAQAAMFSEIRVYHEAVDPEAFGPEERRIYDWTSSMGHDSQSWDVRRHTAAVHRIGESRYVIERILAIDGSTQKEKHIVTVGLLRSGREEAAAEEIMRAVETIRCRSADSYL